MTSRIIVIHASSKSDLRCVLTEETASHRVTYSARGRDMCVYLYLQTQGFHVRVAAGERGGEPRGNSDRTRVIYSHVELHRWCERLLKFRHNSVRLTASSRTYPERQNAERAQSTRRRRYFSKRCFAKWPRRLSRRSQFCQPPVHRVRSE